GRNTRPKSCGRVTSSWSTAVWLSGVSAVSSLRSALLRTGMYPVAAEQAPVDSRRPMNSSSMAPASCALLLIAAGTRGAAPPVGHTGPSTEPPGRKPTPTSELADSSTPTREPGEAMVAEHTPAAKVSAESLEATCAHPLANTESCTHCMASTASGSAQVTVHSSDQPAPWPHSTFCRVQPAYPARSGYMYGVSASVSSGAHSSNSSQVSG